MRIGLLEQKLYVIIGLHERVYRHVRIGLQEKVQVIIGLQGNIQVRLDRSLDR